MARHYARPMPRPTPEYWNENAGPAWVRMQERVDRLLEPIGRIALDALELRTGHKVIDVGCGCGSTTVELARRVGPSGRVVGVDVSSPMLSRASDLCAKLDRVELRLEDAQTAQLDEAEFDAVFSRFGVMFFEDPVAAFGNLFRAMVRGGTMVFACWQAPQQNPWLVASREAAASIVDMGPPPSPDDPGPMMFADPSRIRDVLSKAGFDDIDPMSWSETMTLGTNLDDVVDMFMEVGPAGAVLRETNADESTCERVRDAMRDVFARFSSDDGVASPAAAWIVRARS